VRYVVLAATVAASFVIVLVAAALAPEQLRWPVVDGIVRACKVIGLFGCLVGALSFGSRQHLFRGWALIAGSYALLVLRDAVLYRHLIDDPERWIEASVVLSADVLGVLGAWMMAGAWYLSGIALPGSRTTRRIVRAVAAAMAVSITLPALWIHVPQLGSGPPHAIMGIANALADAISIALIAPVLLTALALRGAATAWPWALLTASLFGWLCYDATFSLSVAHDPGGAFRALGEAFHALACVGCGVAGIAQRLVVTSAPPRRA
jgi:hypothetical protein